MVSLFHLRTSFKQEGSLLQASHEEPNQPALRSWASEPRTIRHKFQLFNYPAHDVNIIAAQMDWYFLSLEIRLQAGSFWSYHWVRETNPESRRPTFPSNYSPKLTSHGRKNKIPVFPSDKKSTLSKHPCFLTLLLLGFMWEKRLRIPCLLSWQPSSKNFGLFLSLVFLGMGERWRDSYYRIGFMIF